MTGVQAQSSSIPKDFHGAGSGHWRLGCPVMHRCEQPESCQKTPHFHAQSQKQKSLSFYVVKKLQKIAKSNIWESKTQFLY